MKTRYNILLVIVIASSVYGGLNVAINSCNAISECEILYSIYEHVGFSIVTQMCATDETSSDVMCDADSYEIALNNTGYFFLFFVLVPSSIITAIWYKARK